LKCTPKHFDSKETSAQTSRGQTGLSPSMGCGPSQGGLKRASRLRDDAPKHHIPRDREGRQFGDGLCPFHSPLL